MNFPLLREMLEKHEGRRSHPYQCTAGKTTIGVGHNLTDNGLPDDVIDMLLDKDIVEALRACSILFRTWHNVPSIKQVVLANMAFQLGHKRFRKFKKLIAAVNEADWDEAAKQMQDSKWYTQSGNRSVELVNIMQNEEVTYGQ